MPMTHSIANLLLTTLLLGLGLYLYWEYRAYRVERARYRLFMLRDELFALARDGALPFDSPAYGMLRMMLNGAIRFAHRANALDLAVMYAIVRRSRGVNEARERISASWARAVERLDPEVKKRVGWIHRRYLQTIVANMFMSSMVLSFFLVPLVLILGLIHLSSRCALFAYGLIVPIVGPDLDYIATNEADQDLGSTALA